MEQPNVVVEKQLTLFESFSVPVWVFDIDNLRVNWANNAALSLWDTDSVEALCSRDMSKDMSPSVRTRLRQYQEDFRLGAELYRTLDPIP